MRVQFRPTLWPGTVLATPKLRPMYGVEIQGDWIAWPVQGWQNPVELPHDFYLRELMEIEPSDLHAVADMMTQFGLFFDFEQRGIAEDFRIEIPEPSQVSGDPDAVDPTFHKDEVRLHLELAQDAIRTWMALQYPDSYERLQELAAPDLTDEHFKYFVHNSSGPKEDLTRDHFEEVTLSVRLLRLTETMNSALSGMHVGAIRSVFGHEEKHLPGYHTIYSTSFLQLYNHMVEQAPFKNCANETCGRAFVRQRGRSQYDQNRLGGVKYCSRNCARAQAQRELRRRRSKSAS